MELESTVRRRGGDTEEWLGIEWRGFGDAEIEPLPNDALERFLPAVE